MEYYVDLKSIRRALSNLALKHHEHFEQSSKREEIDKSVFYGRISLGLCPEWHPDQFDILNELGNFLYTRFQQHGRVEDLEESIKHHRAALERCPSGHPDRSLSLNNLALSLQGRFRHCGQSGDLDEAIRHNRAALELLPNGHPNRFRSLNNLAISLRTRFEQHGRTADLDEAVKYLCTALELLPNGHPNRSLFLNNLANSLQTRFQQDGQVRDLNEAIRLHRAALELFPKGHPIRPGSLNNLAACLQTRFTRHGQITDFDEAIELQRSALELFPDGHPSRFASLSNFATCLHMRFEQRGQAADLDGAVKFFSTALEVCPDGHPDRLSLLGNLSRSLRVRFELHGRTADLEKTIDYQRAALKLGPLGAVNRSISLGNLAYSLQTRFEQHGNTADLDEAIEHNRTALELRPIGHPDRHMSLNNLADCLRTRFRQYGQIADLDEAIKYLQAALELLPDGYPKRYMVLNNLANSFHARFEQLGQTADLDTVIECSRAALELEPGDIGHPDRHICLLNLATSLQTRFQQRGQTVDLDEAIRHNRAALELLPSDHTRHYKCLHNLANSLLIRFRQLHQTADLDDAVKYHRATLELYPNHHPDRYLPLSSLANSLRIRFDQYGETFDLDEADKYYQAALELRPEGHPDHSTSLGNLGCSFHSRFNKFGVTNNLHECMQLLERASEHKFSSLMERLRIAGLWTEFARSHSHHSTSRAYRTAIFLLQRSLTIGPTLHAQHDFLRQKIHYKEIALDAAAYAIEGNRLEEAVEILEQGRTLLWSQMRGFRTPIDFLAETNSELADRFRDVSHQLESLATSSTELRFDSSTAGGKSSVLDLHGEQRLFEERLSLKRQLSDEQEKVINEIRQIPGFENFLEATPFKTLRRAALEGPVIVVNHCRYRSDVLIILSHEEQPVVCVPLDGEFYKDGIDLYTELVGTRSQYGANSAEYDRVLRRVMKTLWDRVVLKVVDKLKEFGIAEGSRIWWCPTSWLSALPFHAAGPFEDTDGTSKYLLDKYISSYTPTLEALINSQSYGNGGEPTALVIGDTSLRSAKDEIRKIRNCGIQTKLLSSKASHDVVIKELRKTTWVHFVCHGCLDSKPFKSSFKVSSRGLTLLDIVQANLPRAEFAFLSACHTAGQSFEVAHDEVLHLAAAIQFSGFRSVIGSMWELLDEDGPSFARVIYEYMCNCDDGEARHKRAAAGLHKAAIELKERPDIQAERWVNLIHIGA